MKKILCALLVLTMLLSGLIIPVSAADDDAPEVLGASIRITGTQGLRFVARIKKTVADAEGVTGYGFLIIPESSLEQDEVITKDTPNVRIIPAEKVMKQFSVEQVGVTYNDDYYYFSVVQKGIPANFYTTQMVVKAYVIDNNEYIYSNSPATEKRSIEFVAKDLLTKDPDNAPTYNNIIDIAAEQGADIYVNAGKFAILEKYPDYPSSIAKDTGLYTVSVSQGTGLSKKTENLSVYNQTASYSHVTPTENSRALGAMDSNRRFCEFAFAYDTVTVNITVNKKFTSYVVSPTSKEFASSYANGVISVTLNKPTQFVVILDDDYKTALSVFADAPEYEYDIPEKGADNVVYVEGDSEITLPKNQPTLVTYEGPNNEIMVVQGHKTKIYLAPGAVLKKGIFASRTKDGGYAAKIYGRGAILDPYSDYTTSDATVAVALPDCYDQNSGATKDYSALKAVINCYQFSCTLKDIKVLDARRFNILFAQSGCSADNVKVLSTEMSTDGFMCSQNVTVKNCFVYCGDNALVIQGGSGDGHYYENITIGTTCAAVYPQYSFVGSLKDIYVFRADDGLINVHQDNSGAMTMNIDGLDALDCVKTTVIFGDNGGTGSDTKTFNLKNVVTRYTTGAKTSFTPGTYTSQYNALECSSTGYILNFTNLCVGGHRIGPNNSDESSLKVGSAYLGSNSEGGTTQSGMTVNFAYEPATMPAHTSVPANKTANYTGGADYVAGPIRGWTEAKSYNCKVKWNGGTSYTVSETEDTSKWGFSLDLTEIMRTHGAGTYSVTYNLSKGVPAYLIKCGNKTNVFTKTNGGGASKTWTVTVTETDIRDNTYQILIYANSTSVNTFTMNSFSISVPNS